MKFARVSQAAAELGVSADTLRRMDRDGRFSPSIRAGAMRVYSEADIAQLRRMLRGLREIELAATA